MKVHELKTWRKYFAQLYLGSKNFEVRLNDRDFKFGDQLLLKEWDEETEKYTGMILHRSVSYVLEGGQFGIEPGYVVMSLSKI